MLPSKALFLLCVAPYSLAQVTVYGQLPLGQTVSSAPWATTTVLAAYNDTRLNPPPIPNPAPQNAFTLQLQRDANAVPGLSIPHVGGSFFGFSIEMSVITQVLGKNSSFIQVPFLNLMANLQERAGGVVVRLGGNTQEFATLVESDQVEPGHTFGKENSGSTQTTLTPAVLYTIDMFYMASNISSHVNVKWFLGIPFNDSVNWRLSIAEHGQEILGDNLLGLQAGNEPDFYEAFKRRVAPYTPLDYHREVGELIEVMDRNPKITNKHMLIAPSVSGQVWHAEQVWETNFIPTYRDRLYALTVEHYPNNNCVAMFTPGAEGEVDPQVVFPYYLNHNNIIELVRPYHNSAGLARDAGKPFMMFETNTASCGGFPGISDTYTAALWAMDYGFQMAHSNFTHALLHVGGQNVYYNPFTAPPTNQTEFNEWSVGTVYYAALVLAEAFGKTNTSQIIDLGANNANEYTPAYAIYERGALSKVALFNYMDNPTATANDLVVSVSVPNGGVPASVGVKYLRGDSVSSKNNITWASQTFGDKLTVDGRLRGNMVVDNIPCDQAANVCRIPVPAPGFALVFFGQSEALTISQSPTTFSTSAYVKKHNTITYDIKVLETSNGHNSGDLVKKLGSSTYGSHNSGVGLRSLLSGAAVTLAMAFGGLWVFRAVLQ